MSSKQFLPEAAAASSRQLLSSGMGCGAGDTVWLVAGKLDTLSVLKESKAQTQPCLEQSLCGGGAWVWFNETTGLWWRASLCEHVVLDVNGECF